MDDDSVGKFTSIEFKNGLAHMKIGSLEPSSLENFYFERQRVLVMRQYKSVFEKVFKISGYGEDICNYFENMNYGIKIEEFFGIKTVVTVIDLNNGETIFKRDSLVEVLKELDYKRFQNFLNNI